MPICKWPLLAALTLFGFVTPSVCASASTCSAEDRDALLVGGIVLGVKNRATQNSAGGRCFAVSMRWTGGEAPDEPSDRVLARVRRIVRGYRVVSRTDSVRREIEDCLSWVSVTVGEPLCRGDVGSVQVEGEHCAPVFQRVGKHWEGRPQPCE